MIQNSLNRLVNRKKMNSNTDDCEWEAKYDISISILKEEYLQCIQRIRNVDEKANKYILVISIVATGLFVVLSSSAADSLVFDHLNSIIGFLLTLLFVATSLLSLILGILIFKYLLDCFELVESKKINNIEELLRNTVELDANKYKGVLITVYQASINSMNQTVINKQNHIRKVSNKIRCFISLLFTSLLILIILKIIG
ncbi:hypothetical protein [Psychrobacter sp. DWR1-2-3]|uniref:hypothetical protein n=1 Tax=Psychrobacter sp. DWR1-2-3 TaxID=2804637 RepID=UPI003CE81785